MRPELGTPVRLRDVVSFDDLCDVIAPPRSSRAISSPAPKAVYRVEVVLKPPPGAPVVPVLVRPVELRMSTYA
jgi:hypothetical protein